jgi:D-lactate dehydrogenase
MKTLVYSAHPYDTAALQQLNDRHELVFTSTALRPETVHLAEGFSAVSVFSSDQCHAEVLEGLHRCGVRYIALRSAGTDHLDITSAEDLGIRWGHVPEYSPYAIAEFAVTLLMAFNRRLDLARDRFQQHDFRLDGLEGMDLHGKTVGIVGTGKTGMAFARIMKGFGCTLLGCDPEPAPEATSIDMTYHSLHTLLQASDVVSIHCPLTEHTRHLFSSKEFAHMRSHSILINTARGAVVDSQALLTALDQGQLRGACLDVYEREKPLYFKDHRHAVIEDALFLALANHPKVWMAGHQAFLTHEALHGIASKTLEHLDGWERDDNASFS